MYTKWVSACVHIGYVSVRAFKVCDYIFPYNVMITCNYNQFDVIKLENMLK